MGEYARSLAIAKAAVRRWPRLYVHFVLSAAAPYAAETPFPSTFLPSSPTFHIPEVNALIRELKPSLVLFDNAGRTAQIDAAHACGARIIFISSRRRQRRKAFRLRWMRFIDEHWIACPELIAGSLTPIERFKLRLSGRPRVRFLDTVLPETDGSAAEEFLSRLQLHAGDYVLIVPGSGTPHPGAEDAPEIFATVAQRLARRGCPVVLVGVTEWLEAGSGLHLVPRIPMDELCGLICGARMVISNGGDTLLQALACRRACVGVPVARDQYRRVARCADNGLIAAARLDVRAIESAAIGLLENDDARGELEARIARHRMDNAMEMVLGALGTLSGVI